MMQIQWIKDSKVEEFIRSKGVEFEADEAIPISELVTDWRTNNLARPHKAVLDDVVETIAELMAAGVKFPFCVVLKTALGYLLLDGTQRCSAVELGDGTVFAAYVLLCRRKRTIDEITFGLNSIHGIRPDDSLRIEQAFMLIERHGMTDAEAEAAMSLRHGTIEKKRNEKTVRRICDENGVDSSGFTNGKVESVAQLLQDNPKMIPKVVKLSNEGKLRSNEVDQVVEGIKNANSVDAKLKCIDEWANRPDVVERREGKRKDDETQRLLSMLRSLDTYSKEHFSSIYLTAKMADEIDRVLKRVDGRIKQIVTHSRTPSSK